MIGATYKKNEYGSTYLPLLNPDLSRLSAREKDVIDHVLDRLSNMNAGQISGYSHNDVPWLTTDEGDIIPYEAVFYRTPAYSVRKDDADADV